MVGIIFSFGSDTKSNIHTLDEFNFIQINLGEDHLLRDSHIIVTSMIK